MTHNAGPRDSGRQFVSKSSHCACSVSHERGPNARSYVKSPPPPSPTNKISDEKERLREKNWRARRLLLVCGPKAIFTFSFPVLLAVLCAHMRERKGGQTSLRFKRASDGSFGRTLRARSEALRVSSPFLSKSLKKAFLYRCEKAKVKTCTATESKQIPRLVMVKLCLPASCC